MPLFQRGKHYVSCDDVSFQLARSKDQTHQPAYQTVYEASELGSLDPPLEFKDANYESVLKGTNRRSNSSTDYAIAV